MDPSTVSTPPKRAIGQHASPASVGRGVGSSPAYLSSIRKHSLYGTDDRVIIDPGSRIWKIGFSGEPRPRKVFYPTDSFDDALSASDGDPGTEMGTVWDINLGKMAEDLDTWRVRCGWGDVSNEEVGSETGEDVVVKVEGETRERKEEVSRLIRARVVRIFRDVYYKHLLTESRSRKVIIVENPFLPDPIKDIIAEVLLDNLQVRSVSFTPASLLALMAYGRTTGLVCDVGYWETTVVPVFQGRVLTGMITSSPIAGKSFLDRLGSLVNRYARWSTSEAPASTGEAGQMKTTLKGLEKIRSGCFVAPCGMDGRVGPRIHSDEEMMRMYGVVDSTTAEPRDKRFNFTLDEARLGVKAVLVPGWIRERTAEVLFETGEEDEKSVQEVICDTLVKLPIDLRRVMSTSMLIAGGGGCLPGFKERVKSEIKAIIQRSFGDGGDGVLSTVGTKTATESMATTMMGKNMEDGPAGTEGDDQDMRAANPLNAARKAKREKIKTLHQRPYGSLVGLKEGVGLINLDQEDEGWNPGLIPWIGGSLAGALQIGGEEYEYDHPIEA